MIVFALVPIVKQYLNEWIGENLRKYLLRFSLINASRYALIASSCGPSIVYKSLASMVTNDGSQKRSFGTLLICTGVICKDV